MVFFNVQFAKSRVVVVSSAVAFVPAGKQEEGVCPLCPRGESHDAHTHTRDSRRTHYTRRRDSYFCSFFSTIKTAGLCNYGEGKDESY